MDEYIKRKELQKMFKSVTEDCTCPLHIAAEIDQILDQADAADVVEVVRSISAPTENGRKGDLMKFKNWTPEDLKRWAALLPSSPDMNPHNKIKIWGEIHVENDEPINPCDHCMSGSYRGCDGCGYNKPATK